MANADQEFICIFTCSRRGISGNELPPPIEATATAVIIAGPDESFYSFKCRMQAQGMAIRNMLEEDWKLCPRPYSCASGCDWRIIKRQGVAAMLAEIRNDS